MTFIVNGFYLFLISVNAVDAGPGNLEVMITCQGELVKNTARTIPNTGLVEVTYVPICLQPHVINVKYNGENIPGWWLETFGLSCCALGIQSFLKF